MTPSGTGFLAPLQPSGRVRTPPSRVSRSGAALLILAVVAIALRQGSSPATGAAAPGAVLQGSGPAGDYFGWLGAGTRAGEAPGTGPRGEPVLRWRSEPVRPVEQMAVSGGVLAIAGTGDGGLTAYDLATGIVGWSYAFAGFPRRLFAGPDGLYLLASVGSNAAGIVAIEPVSGQERWRYAPIDATVADVVPDAPGGVLALVRRSDGTDLCWLDPATGAERRSVPLAEDTPTGRAAWLTARITHGPGAHTLAVDGAAVYLTDASGAIGAVEAATGTLRWRTETGLRLTYGPTVAGDVVLATARGATAGDGVCDVEVDPESGWVVALDTTTGRVRWRATFAQVAPPTVADGVAMLVDGADLVALDLANGDERWRARTAGRVGWVPLAAEGLVYVTSDDARVAAVEIASGTTRWSLDIGRPGMIPLAVASGTLLLGPREAPSLWDSGGPSQPLIAIGGAASLPPGSGTPIPEGDVSGLPPCDVPNRNGTPTSPGSRRSPVLGSREVAPWQVPEGELATPELTAEITAAVASLQRCNRPGFVGELSGGMTREFAKRERRGPGVVWWVPPAWAEVQLLEVRLLADGRVLAVLPPPWGVAPGTAGIVDGARLLVFVAEDGRWLVDEAAALPTECA